MATRAAATKKKTRIQAKNEQKILDAALTIFSQYGFRGSTIDQIADTANLSKPNVLYYFSNKQDIYVQLLQQTLNDWVGPMAKIDPLGDPIQEIIQYATTKLEMSRTHAESSRLFANEILHGAPTIKGLLKGGLKDLVDEKAAVFQKWMDQGRIAQVDPHHLIFMIWSTTQHYADFDVQVRAVLGSSRSKKQNFLDAQSTIKTILINGLKIQKPEAD